MANFQRKDCGRNIARTVSVSSPLMTSGSGNALNSRTHRGRKAGLITQDCGWRIDRDSNPRDGSPPTHFPGVRLRPLGHRSVGRCYRGWGAGCKGGCGEKGVENWAITARSNSPGGSGGPSFQSCQFPPCQFRRSVPHGCLRRVAGQSGPHPGRCGSAVFGPAPWVA